MFTGTKFPVEIKNKDAGFKKAMIGEGYLILRTKKGTVLIKGNIDSLEFFKGNVFNELAIRMEND